MDGRSNKGLDLTKPSASDLLAKANKSVPRGLLYRELGFKQRQNSVSAEFQRAAEDRLVLKNHEELPCELPDVSRSTFLMVFSPDGTKVASTHGNHNVYVTDLNTGKNVNTLSGHPRTPWCIAFHPSSNQILASGCLGGQVRVWDLHGGSEIWTAESQTVIASLAFHPTDRMLVIATYNELHFWDWSQPVPFTKCYTSNEKEKVRYVAFDPLGHKLITGISNPPHNQSQWDRVATPSRQGSNLATSSSSSSSTTTPSTTTRTNSMLPPEHERRITFCYRSLVEQYEQLVQRYYDLSRLRSTATMDRGTDPMDMSESSSGSRSNSGNGQSQSQTGNTRSRMNLMSDSGTSSSSGTTSSTGDGNGSGSNNSANNNRPGSSDRPLRSIPSVVLMHSLMRRLDRESSLLNSESNRDNQTGDSSRRRSDDRFQEPPDMHPRSMSTDYRPSSTSDFGRRRGSMNEERQIAPESTSRNPNGPPPSAPVSERYLFSRLHSQAQPASPSPPERPRRFFVSQRSAFQPRTPRGNVERLYPRSSTRSYSSLNLNSGRCFLQRRLAGSYNPQNRDDTQSEDAAQSESSSQQGLDTSSDVGVRYGIQLLSRHIDNMQRLCRARLEILQLQQIRRMWEDLQRQIRSLHLAVRESTYTFSDSPETPVSRGRRRLYSHPREYSGQGVGSGTPLRRNSCRSGEPETSSTEQGGPHIPSVSQMLELARISDIGPSPGSGQSPVPSSSAETSNEQPSSSRDQTSPQDVSRKGTLARLHARFAALTTRLKFVTDKTKKDGESCRNNPEASLRNEPLEEDRTSSTSEARALSSDGEPSVSQSANLDSSDVDREPVAGSSTQPIDVPVSTDKLLSNRNVDSNGGENTVKAENLREHKAEEDEDDDDLAPPSKRKHEDKTLISKSNGKAQSSSVTAQDTISGNSSGIPTILTTTATTNTTVTSSPVLGRTSTRSGSSRDQPSESTSPNTRSWNRGPVDSSLPPSPTTPPATSFSLTPSNPVSLHPRLWCISRRVYLRRPRLLALGPRTRTMTRQLSGGTRNIPIFRHNDNSRRPWFMQSGPARSQQGRMSQRGVSTAAQVDTRETSRTAEGREEDRERGSNHPDSNPVLSSDTSPEVSASDQSSSPSEETSIQSTNKSVACDSSQSDAQPGPSGLQEDNTESSSSHDVSSQHNESAAHGKKRKADAVCPSSRNIDSPQTQSNPQREQTTSESLRAMIARLEALVRQQREQREAARRETQEGSAGRGGRRTNLWGLRERERPLWVRGDGNSGSDSDSNPEIDRQRSWGRYAPDERLITALENELNNNPVPPTGSRRGRSGSRDDDREWTRESTRLRARQVLSLMVESLTQFFEENGLGSNASHAVLDEQIYNLYILLQLALELTDLLLAQLISTRRELEHQWVHRLQTPGALDDAVMTAAERVIEERQREIEERQRALEVRYFPPRRSVNVGSGSRGTEDNNFQPRRRGQPPVRDDDNNTSTSSDQGGFVLEEYVLSRRRGRLIEIRDDREGRRVPPRQDTGDNYNSTYRHYRQFLDCLIRNRQNPFDSDSSFSQYLRSSTTGRNSPSSGVNRGESTRRLGPRVVNCYSRHGSHGSLSAGARVGRGTSSRPLIRSALTRRESGVRLPSYARDSPSRLQPYPRSSSNVRLPGRVRFPNFEEPNSPTPPIRSPHIMVRVQNPSPATSAPANEQSSQEQSREQQQEQAPQQQPPTSRQQDAFTVPLVRVNDVLIPDTSLLNQPQPRQRPQSPPPHPSPHLRNPFIQHQQQQQQGQQPQSPLRYLNNPPSDIWRLPGIPADASWRSGWRPRFLHPRYMAPNPFSDDNEEHFIASPLENINFIRDSFIITDAPMSPNHRIQAWDFSKFNIPDISNAEKNVIVAECKIHNDASVDVSSDGRLLVTLLPTGRLTSTAMLGVYSLEWESLGQCLYTTSFEQNAVSVSLSPASRHLLVGLASRRVALLPSDRHTMAQIFRLEGGVPGRNVGARGRLCHLRDIEQDREQGYMSLNCIRWAPGPGQGLVYGTNTGKLRVLR